mmetsp:Transcript_102948/g.297629  ORF Transcript_102948/g.297629 Transcript_102948/m.297629 type:complete len:280 (-) Transcript_102948:273-1112(-)
MVQPRLALRRIQAKKRDLGGRVRPLSIALQGQSLVAQRRQHSSLHCVCRRGALWRERELLRVPDGAHSTCRQLAAPGRCLDGLMDRPDQLRGVKRLQRDSVGVLLIFDPNLRRVIIVGLLAYAREVDGRPDVDDALSIETRRSQLPQLLDRGGVVQRHQHEVGLRSLLLARHRRVYNLGRRLLLALLLHNGLGRLVVGDGFPSRRVELRAVSRLSLLLEAYPQTCGERQVLALGTFGQRCELLPRDCGHALRQLLVLRRRGRLRELQEDCFGVEVHKLT